MRHHVCPHKEKDCHHHRPKVEINNSRHLKEDQNGTTHRMVQTGVRIILNAHEDSSHQSICLMLFRNMGSHMTYTSPQQMFSNQLMVLSSRLLFNQTPILKASSLIYPQTNSIKGLHLRQENQHCRLLLLSKQVISTSNIKVNIPLMIRDTTLKCNLCIQLIMEADSESRIRKRQHLKQMEAADVSKKKLLQVVVEVKKAILMRKTISLQQFQYSSVLVILIKLRRRIKLE